MFVPRCSDMAPTGSLSLVSFADIVEQLMDLYKTARQRAEEDAKKKAATSVPPRLTGPQALPAAAT